MESTRLDTTYPMMLPDTTAENSATNASYFSLFRQYVSDKIYGTPKALSEVNATIISENMTTNIEVNPSKESAWVSSQINSKMKIEVTSENGTITVQNFYTLKCISSFTLCNPLLRDCFVLNLGEKKIPYAQGAYWIPCQGGFLKAPKDELTPVNFYPIKKNEDDILYYPLPSHGRYPLGVVFENRFRKKFKIYDFENNLLAEKFYKKCFKDIYTDLNDDLILTFYQTDKDSVGKLQLSDIKGEKYRMFNEDNWLKKNDRFNFYKAENCPDGIVVGVGKETIYLIDINNQSVTTIPVNEGSFNFIKFIDRNDLIYRFEESNIVHLCNLQERSEIAQFAIGENSQYNGGAYPLVNHGDQLVSLDPESNKKLKFWDLSGKDSKVEYEAADLSLHELQLSGKGDRIVGLHYCDRNDSESSSVLYVWDFKSGKMLFRNEQKGYQSFCNVSKNMLAIDCSNQADFSTGFGYENPNPPETLDVNIIIRNLDDCSTVAEITEKFAFVTGTTKLIYSFKETGVGEYDLTAWWGLNNNITLIKKMYELK